MGVSDGERRRYLEEIAGIAREAGLRERPRLNVPIEEAGVTFFTRECSAWSNLVYDSERSWPCWGLDQLHLLATGDVALCCHDWLAETAVGNLRDATLREIWEGKPRRALVDSIRLGDPPPSICRGCQRCDSR